MKFLLVAVNAKYIHSNLGVYSLKTYAEKRLREDSLSAGYEMAGETIGQRSAVIEIAEYTINQQTDEILRDIYLRKPDVIGFSCYIWNIALVRRLIRDIKKVLPTADIWLGGPEVSYDAEKTLAQEPGVMGVMTGEGEETFSQLMKWYLGSLRDEALSDRDSKELSKTDRKAETKAKQEVEALSCIAGIIFRGADNFFVTTPTQKPLDMDAIPFPYENLEGMEHRIIYYESSRGCPFRCSYCLSSIDKQVRFRSLDLVEAELDYFLARKVPQVKFVDRTFNCDRKRALDIWRYVSEHDNGITNFHFEISADLMDEDQLQVLSQMRPGLIQLEIGVQTTYEPTIKEIHRNMDLERLKKIVDKVHGFGNIRQHLDLIAGLPFEGLERFRISFDDVYHMKPDQLQLGFLKVLKGSYMEEMAQEYGIVYYEEPPYEVLSTRWLSYKELLELKAVEEMVEVYYNSGQFKLTLAEMDNEWTSPYEMFRELARFYEAHSLVGISHSRMSRFEILYDFLISGGSAAANRISRYRDLLTCDLYLRENAKSRPAFAGDLGPYKQRIKDFFRHEKESPQYLPGYEKYDARQLSSMAHAEILSDDTMVVFDYQKRDPLNHNARMIRIEHEEK